MAKHKKKSKKHKEKKSKHKHKKRHDSSSSSSSIEDEWVEKKDNLSNEEKEVTKEEIKPKDESLKRDDWMDLTSLSGLYSHKYERKLNEENKRKEKEANKYDPKTSIRELNPYWKDGGEGLPSVSKPKFMRPSENTYSSFWKSENPSRGRSSNWRKKDAEEKRNTNYDKQNSSRKRNDDDSSREHRRENYSKYDRKSAEQDSNVHIKEVATGSKSSDIIYESEEKYQSEEETRHKTENPIHQKAEVSDALTDKEMNDIAAKIVKAEILGNLDRVAGLKEKLERARVARSSGSTTKLEEEKIILSRTNSKGFSKPLSQLKSDPYDNKRRKQTVNTHDAGKRQKYYPDDEKHSLHNMFESEKFSSSEKQDEEFMKAAAKLSKMDDLEDMFMDNIRKKQSDEKTNKKDREKAIQEHKRVTESLDNCIHCVQSTNMLKHLMVSLGETVFLSLPQYEPLTDGHCLLLPVRHVTCSTQLDENEWSEILQLRKSLTNMYKSENKTAIFYETAINFHHYPHMVIHCVPVPEDQGDLAPIYFKKAIDECEMEWSTNKKLIKMEGKDVRRSVPKGLPYFWVSFGMQEGFAHVIEEQKYFPKFFAEEIIGGILDLHHSKWRKAGAQKFDIQKSRVLEFSKNWSKFDCTTTN